jgi:carbamate kinase
MAGTAVVALGGNAITRSGQTGTSEEQTTNARSMAKAVCELREAGWRVVLVHGNGPQVGNIAIQQEEAAHRVPELPLFWQNAMTVGQLGSLLTLALHEAGGGRLPGVATVVTHVLVDRADPAFDRPTKPIGPFMSEDEAGEHAAARGWTVTEDAGRGFRRIVPSPRPLRIIEIDAIRTLMEQGLVVVAAGGGGLPVVQADGSGYLGLDAVIDKDLTAQELANALDADALVLVTDVAQVMLDYGTPRARPIVEMTVEEAEGHAAAGQFPPGSMGPKMHAAVRFLRGGGRTAVITNADLVSASLGAQAGPGTRILGKSPRGSGGADVGAARTGAA